MNDRMRFLRKLEEHNKLFVEYIDASGGLLTGKTNFVDLEKANLKLELLPDVAAGYRSAREATGILMRKQDAAEYNNNWDKAEACKSLIKDLRDRALSELLSE